MVREVAKAVAASVTATKTARKVIEQVMSGKPINPIALSRHHHEFGLFIETATEATTVLELLAADTDGQIQ